jgi:hypothetical protein
MIITFDITDVLSAVRALRVAGRDDDAIRDAWLGTNQDVQHRLSLDRGYRLSKETDAFVRAYNRVTLEIALDVTRAEPEADSSCQPSAAENLTTTPGSTR